jgi:hypothetical protein
MFDRFHPGLWQLQLGTAGDFGMQRIRPAGCDFLKIQTIPPHRTKIGRAPYSRSWWHVRATLTGNQQDQTFVANATQLNRVLSRFCGVDYIELLHKRHIC